MGASFRPQTGRVQELCASLNPSVAGKRINTGWGDSKAVQPLEPKSAKMVQLESGDGRKTIKNGCFLKGGKACRKYAGLVAFWHGCCSIVMQREYPVIWEGRQRRQASFLPAPAHVRTRVRIRWMQSSFWRKSRTRLLPALSAGKGYSALQQSWGWS